MQKLFSMFPSGAPGLALLMLRLFLGATPVADSLSAITSGGVVADALLACTLAIAVGLVTPIAAVLSALIESIGLARHIESMQLQAFAPVVIATALALLGPGAYSLDARIFGRRLMKFGPHFDDEKKRTFLP